MEASGSVIRTELTTPVSGDVLELWAFLMRFREMLGLQKCFSFEELIAELNGPFSDGLSEAYILMLQVLISEFKEKYGKCSTKSPNTKPNAPPLNDLTWPELARRYILAMLMTQDPDSKGVCADEFRLLYSDGGHKCGALTGLVGMEADALLLAASTNKIYRSLSVVNEELCFDEKATRKRTMSNESIPGWVQVLDPIKDLKTNNGSRIRNCINDSLGKNPPEWARELLEHSVSKGVYKGNASGPTKRLALHVVDEFHNKQQNMTIVGNKKDIPVDNIVTKYCQIMLRRASASKETKRFCKLLEQKNVQLQLNNIGVLGSPAEVSSLLYFRMIDMRLAADAYCGSHEAFFEDVQEFWRAVQIEFCDIPTLIKFAMEASHVFESLYIKEVVALHRKLEEYSHSKSLSALTLQDIDYDIICANEIPKAPWDEGVCKVCSINKDNEKVLLCDECDAEYHTYCLNPPLLEIPEGNWFCPCCVANKYVEDVSPGETSLIDQFEMIKNGKFAALETMIRGKEKWELSLHERTLLLKFLCDEMLDSSLLRNHLNDLNDIEGSSLRAGYLGNDNEDSGSELYWTVDFDKKPWIFVNYTNRLNLSSSIGQEISNNSMLSETDLLNHKGSKVYSTWICSQSDDLKDEVVKLFDDKEKENHRLKIKEMTKLELDNWNNFERQNSVEFRSVFVSFNNLKAKATKVLEFKYGLFFKMETTGFLKKNKGKEVVGHLGRCECLEPILPEGNHCSSCHRTCFTHTDYRLHVKSGCNVTSRKKSNGVSNLTASKGKEKMITYSNDKFSRPSTLIDNVCGLDRRHRLNQPEGLVSDNFINVPAASESSLMGKASEILTQLKLNLLDMEAVVPSDALKPSRTSIGKKWAWRSFLKHASTIYEMNQALIVFEDMIKLEYLDSAWGFWSSISATANISTLSALSLRIYSLDAAITYDKKSQPSDLPELLGRANSARRKPSRRRESESTSGLK